MPPKKKVVAKKAAVTEGKIGSIGENIVNGEDEPIGTKRDKLRKNVENSADVPGKKRARPNDVESNEPVKKKRPGKEPEVANEKSKEPPKAKEGKQKKEPEVKEKIKNGEPPQKRGRQKKEPEVREKIENGEPSEQHPQKRGRQKKESKVKEEIENGGPEEPPKKRGKPKEVPEETENVEADNRKKKSGKEAKKTDKTGRTAKNDNLEVGPKDPATKRGKQNKEPEKKKEEKNKQVKTGTQDNKKQSEEITDKKNKLQKKTEKKDATKESSDDSSKQTKWNEIDFNCSNTNMAGEEYNFKITSWNVDGLRAWLKKGGQKIFDHLSPDILCLQETKCTSSQIPDITDFEGYENYWCSSKKNGYAGVGLLSKEKPISVIYGIGNEEQDEDGRCITAEFEKFFLVTVYVPNAGRKLVTLDKRLEWNEIFKDFINDLDKRKPVIICGDMNVAHSEIDLTNPKTNTKNAGFTKEERDGLTNFLNEGYVDTFRVLYPEKKDSYTFWTYMNNARKRNIGWRLDYFIVSQRLQKNICDNVIYDKVFGSDHCPLTLFMNI